MKTIPFLCILSTFFVTPMISGAQDPAKESLSRYSYPIFTVTGKQQHTGTAFFFKQGDTSFLVSNYHAIKGMNPLQQNINFQVDSLFLKYPVKNSAETKLITLDISEEVTGKTEIFSMVNRIDLMKIPVDLPEDADPVRRATKPRRSDGSYSVTRCVKNLSVNCTAVQSEPGEMVRQKLMFFDAQPESRHSYGG